MGERKTEFWWASIHGADPEPVEKTEHEGRPCIYTLGCADPFYLDETPCPVVFAEDDKMDRPENPLTADEDDERMHRAAMRGSRTFVAVNGERRPVLGWILRHGWRGPR
jgi:hypothetical protein